MNSSADRRRPLDSVQESRFAFVPVALAKRGSVVLRVFFGFTPDHAERRAWRWLNRSSSHSSTGAES